MIADIYRSLRPLAEAVQAAEDALNASNADPEVHPLESLALAGAALKAHQVLGDRMWTLLDAIAGDPTENALTIQGRLNRKAGEYK